MHASKPRYIRGTKHKFSNPRRLKKVVDAYFVKMDQEGKPYTVSGLAYFMKTSRDWLIKTENESNLVSMDPRKAREISNIIKLAKERIQAYVEEYLFTGKNQVGAIFNLKNNFGWNEGKTEEKKDITVAWKAPEK